MALSIEIDLLNADEQFITSYTQGITSLESFSNSWATFGDNLQLQSLDHHSAAQAHAAVSRVESLASAFLKQTYETNALMEEFMSDIQSVLGHLSLGDTCPPLATTPTSNRLPIATTTPSSICPPYIAPAYKWLLKNLHNPYPSKELKERLSRGTGTSLQNIDTWFRNARRRIGWTAISKRHFAGSKIDTVAAAYRALIKDEPHPTIDGTDEEEKYTPLAANLRMAFVEMEDAAKELYTEKFTKSKLAGKLDGMVKDMTHLDKQRRKEEKTKAKYEEKQKEEREREEKKMREVERRWRAAEEEYPSPSSEPDSSRLRSETPSSDDELDMTPSPPTAGCKRSSPGDLTEEWGDGRPAKRSRVLSSSSSSSSVDTHSPMSRHNSTEPFPLSPPSSICPTPPPPTSSEIVDFSRTNILSKRKRSHSDADAGSAPNRPMPLVRPRLQIVSDPLPKSTSVVSPSTVSPSQIDGLTIPDWRHDFLAASSAAVTDELATSGPFELNIFDYSQFADYASEGTSEGTAWDLRSECLKGKDPFDPVSLSSTPSINTPSHSFAPDFDLPSPVPLTDLLHNDFDWNFSATMCWPDVGGITDKLISPSPPFENVKLNHLDGLSSLVSLPAPQFCPTSSDPHSDTSTFIDWPCDIPQTIPSTRMAPLTTFHSPPSSSAIVNPTVYLESCAESRAEKLRKYQEHVAKARQLVVELGFA